MRDGARPATWVLRRVPHQHNGRSTNSRRSHLRSDQMALFRNFYRCDRCEHEWTDVSSATCDDDCPACGARHMSPYKSEDERTDGRDQNTASAAPLSRADRIRQLNDALRQTFIGGRVVVTPGVRELPLET